MLWIGRRYRGLGLDVERIAGDTKYTVRNAASVILAPKRGMQLTGNAFWVIRQGCLQEKRRITNSKAAKLRQFTVTMEENE